MGIAYQGKITHSDVRKAIFRNYSNQGMADENGITIENGETKIESVWSAFSRYKIFNEMVLLYRGKKGMNIFTLNLFASV